MKITIEDDSGKQMTLDTALTIIPPGHTVLICPADKDVFIADHHKLLIERQFDAWGIRALVSQVAVCVWAIANAPA